LPARSTSSWVTSEKPNSSSSWVDTRTCVSPGTSRNAVGADRDVVLGGKTGVSRQVRLGGSRAAGGAQQAIVHSSADARTMFTIQA
jgi:hypothetical protein